MDSSRTTSEFDNTSVEVLDLRGNEKSILDDAGIKTLSQLEDHLNNGKKIPRCGRTTERHLRKALGSYKKHASSGSSIRKNPVAFATMCVALATIVAAVIGSRSQTRPHQADNQSPDANVNQTPESGSGTEALSSKANPETPKDTDITGGIELWDDSPKGIQLWDEPIVEDLGEEIENSIGLKLRLIPAGSFQMGPDLFNEDKKSPQHQQVSLGEFWLGVAEVTQTQYETVMNGQNPSLIPGGDHPVERISWFDAVEFCNALSDLESLTQYYEVDRTEVRIKDRRGIGYRLPTEAEWEYACRAGSEGAYCFGDDSTQLDKYAWYLSDAPWTTHQVGRKKPNAWRLYDMHGNVFEWCWDWYGPYQLSAQTNPIGPAEGSQRVNRGGSPYADPKINAAVLCRSEYRSCHPPNEGYRNLGFRVAKNSVTRGKPANSVTSEE